MILLPNNFFKCDSTSKYIFIFLHIEKTAGTTLTSFFRSLYPYDKRKVDWRAYPAILSDFGTKELQLKHLNILCGHFNYGVHRYFKDRIPIYFTVVREPLERAYSYYNYAIRTPEDSGHKNAKKYDNFQKWLSFNLNKNSLLVKNFMSYRIWGDIVPNKKAFSPIIKRHTSDNFDLVINNHDVTEFINKNSVIIDKDFKIENRKVSKDNKQINISDQLRAEFYDSNIVDTFLYNSFKNNKSNLLIRFNEKI